MPNLKPLTDWKAPGRQGLQSPLNGRYNALRTITLNVLFLRFCKGKISWEKKEAADEDLLA
jgi:hypothetical protein